MNKEPHFTIPISEKAYRILREIMEQSLHSDLLDRLRELKSE